MCLCIKQSKGTKKSFRYKNILASMVVILLLNKRGSSLMRESDTCENPLEIF